MNDSAPAETLRTADQSIIQAIAAFFSQHFQHAHGVELLRGLDVGSGANHCPGLALLPWSGRITLTDPSPENADRLGRAAAGIGVENERGDWVWQPFWAEYARYSGYHQLANPRQLLAARHEVRRARLQDLDHAGWDLGTLFFAPDPTVSTDSTGSVQDQVAASVAAFVRALVPGAPFAASFVVANTVDAVLIDTALIESELGRHCGQLSVVPVEVPDREPGGYTGMVIAYGTTGERGPIISLPAGEGALHRA